MQVSRELDLLSRNEPGPKMSVSRGTWGFKVTSFLVSSRYEYFRPYCEEDEQVKK